VPVSSNTHSDFLERYSTVAHVWRRTKGTKALYDQKNKQLGIQAATMT
jgi:hypothetical protein